MTRFKELKRIEAAIEHKNKDELNWSLVYCKQRLKLAALNPHVKHWAKLIKKIETVKNET